MSVHWQGDEVDGVAVVVADMIERVVDGDDTVRTGEGDDVDVVDVAAAGEALGEVDGPEELLQRPHVVWQKPSGRFGAASEIALHWPRLFCSMMQVNAIHKTIGRHAEKCTRCRLWASKK